MAGNELIIGRAAEHLVCADLILHGETAFLADRGSTYDVIWQIGNKLYRVQVKATQTHKAIPQRKSWIPAHLFQIRRCGKGGRRSYTNDEVDIFALVALDRKEIAYLTEDETPQSIHLRSRDLTYRDANGSYFDEYSLERIKAKLIRNGKDITDEVQA